ncbi:MAG: NUDIX hydrolase [Proteobacteria bacterium]|nr:NUDIX hydrolase [Pseudomonadota bacterium]
MNRIGTIRYRASAVVVSNNELLTVRLQDPYSKIVNYFVPGGKVEEFETPSITAIRETWEEAGVRITLIEGSDLVVTYPFTWNNELFECTTTYFAAVCADRSIPNDHVDADYNLGAQWVPLDDIDKRMGFDPNILDPVMKIVTEHFL